jgi:hypothetical protein
MNEETAAIGSGPTNSVGTGVETSLPPAVEPPGKPRGSKVIKRKPKKKIYEAVSTYAFLVSMEDLGDIVVYAKNETQVKNTLRKYLRNLGQIINIRRLFATDVIDFYTKKRSNAVKRIADVVLEATMNPQENPQSAKQDQIQKAQVAKQDAAKRIALAKQNMQKQLQQKKIEMQKSLANQQKTLQQKAKTGSLENTQG